MSKEPLYPHIPKGRQESLELMARNVGNVLAGARMRGTSFAKLNWREMPSVMAGGKPTFFITDTPLGKRWVVWDRVERMWVVKGEQTAPRGEAPTLGRFPSVESGKKFVEIESAGR